MLLSFASQLLLQSANTILNNIQQETLSRHAILRNAQTAQTSHQTTQRTIPVIAPYYVHTARTSHQATEILHHRSTLRTYGTNKSSNNELLPLKNDTV